MKVCKSLCLLVASLAVISCGGHAQSPNFTATPQNAIISPVPPPSTSNASLSSQNCFSNSSTSTSNQEICLLTDLFYGFTGDIGFGQVSDIYHSDRQYQAVTVTLNYLGGSLGSTDVFPATVEVFIGLANSPLSEVAQFSAPSSSRVTLIGPWPAGTQFAVVLTGNITNAGPTGVECLSVCSWDVSLDFTTLHSIN